MMADRALAVVVLSLTVAFAQPPSAPVGVHPLPDMAALKLDEVSQPVPACRILDDYFAGSRSLDQIILHCERTQKWRIISDLFVPCPQPGSDELRKIIFGSILSLLKTDELNDFVPPVKLVRRLHSFLDRAGCLGTADKPVVTIPNQFWLALIDIGIGFVRCNLPLSLSATALLHLVLVSCQDDAVLFPKLLGLLLARHARDMPARVRYIGSHLATWVDPNTWLDPSLPADLLSGFRLLERSQVVISVLDKMCSTVTRNVLFSELLKVVPLFLNLIYIAIRRSDEFPILESPFDALEQLERDPNSELLLDMEVHYGQAVDDILRFLSSDSKLSGPTRIQYIRTIMEIVLFRTNEGTFRPPISKRDWTELVWQLAQYAPECFREPPALFAEMMLFLKRCPQTDAILELLLKSKDVDRELLKNVALQSTPAMFRRLFATRRFEEWSDAFETVLSDGPKLFGPGPFRHLELRLPLCRTLTEMEAYNLRLIAAYFDVSVDDVLAFCDLRLPKT